MKVEIKNLTHKPDKIKSLYDYFLFINWFLNSKSKWLYNGLIVELDPTFDFKSDNVLIRWTDINEGFNDKLILSSLEDFLLKFKLIND